MMDKIYELGDGMRDRIFSNTKDPFLLERFDMWLLEHQGDNPIKDIKFEDIKFENVVLAKIANKIRAGATPSSKIKEYWKDKNETGGLPWLDINRKDFENHKIDSFRKKITKKGYENSSTWLVPKNSVMITIGGSLGFVGYNSFETCTNQNILSVVLDKDYDYKYIILNLENFYKHNIRNLDSKYGNLSKTTESKRIIPIPKPTKYKTSLEIQKLLARFLREYATWSSDMKRLHIKMGQKSAQMRDLLISHTFGADT